MPATDDDTLLPFSLPNICKKKVTAAFDGGQVSSDGGVFLLAAADQRLGLIDTLAGLIPDARDPAQITHSMADILRERVFAIACGYPDGNDLDDLRHDPAFPCPAKARHRVACYAQAHGTKVSPPIRPCPSRKG